MEAFNRMVADRLEVRRAEFINADNVQRFTHGVAWQAHNSSEPDEVTELRTHSHEISIRFDDIKNGRLAIIQEQADALTDAMHEALVRSLFATVSAGADRVGNVVHNQGNVAASLVEMLEKIEFGVDREGNVTRPSIYVAPENLQALDPRLLTAQDPDIQARIEALTKKKTDDALSRERERREKFRGPRP